MSALDKSGITDHDGVMRLRLAALAVSLTAVLAGAGSATAAHRPALASCRSGYYENVSRHCVKRPSTSPVGATARCRDGTFSYSEHASGTCSHHGGVGRWITHP
jgi:hypothetical protein